MHVASSAMRSYPAACEDSTNREHAASAYAGSTIESAVFHPIETASCNEQLEATRAIMVAATLPRTAEQFSLYRAVLDAAGERPVTFRTLDIGGDKVLPYMRNVEEENPALGWRAIRLGLDRPGLLRSQIRALLRAAGGRELKVMPNTITA